MIYEKCKVCIYEKMNAKKYLPLEIHEYKCSECIEFLFIEIFFSKDLILIENDAESIVHVDFFIHQLVYRVWE